ncbi:GtrA family protein [Candidatus Kaiserbacteria bacterium]|nr:GtrA family protein [Candidatus Kaiserbacteria bacterium]
MDGNSNLKNTSSLAEKFSRLVRYGLVTIVGQLAILAAMFVAVDSLGYRPSLAYPVIIVLVYICIYFSSSHFVFRSHDHKKQSPRYVAAVVVFYFLNIGVYTLFVEIINLQYLLSVVLNILLLGPLRYFIYGKFVFNNQETDS